MGEDWVKQAPRVLGRYAIYEPIAAGAMATVHYGRLLGPVGFSRTVAIKRLHPQYAQDPEFVTMFLDEARMAGRIRHANVVATLDVVAASNEIFLVMDYVHGESLAQILRELYARGEKVPLGIALRIASDALQGLHAAHEATDESGMPLNMIHRDVSPQNILLGVDGVARLVDFGVAKASGRAHATRDGDIKGKLSYMPPEQLQGLPISRQADIHALAVVAWEMIAGRRLFKSETATEIAAAVMKHVVPPLSQFVPGIPLAVDGVIRKGLSAMTQKRYATAREMSIALEKCGGIAPTMEVADWVQSQMKETLAERNKRVSSIERDPGGTPEVGSKDPSTGSAKAWVKRLSSPDHSDAAAESTAIAQAEAERAALSTAPPPPLPAAEAGSHDAPPAVAGVVAREPTPSAEPNPIDAREPSSPARAADATRETSEPVDLPLGLPRSPPPAALWAAGVACIALVGGTLWAFAARRPSPSAALAASQSVVVSAAVEPTVSAGAPSSVPTASSAEPAAPADSAAEMEFPANPVAPRTPKGTSPASGARHGTAPPRGAKSGCNPPFKVDAQGVRVPKRECFP